MKHAVDNAPAPAGKDEAQTEPELMLLAALAQDDGAPLARLRKHSGLPMSSLLRACSELSELGLVQRQQQAGRDCLYLTEKGRELCQTR